MTEPRPRTYRLTEEQIEAMLEKAGEKAAEATMKRFGVFDEKGALDLTIKWKKVSDLMDLYDKASLSVGRGVLWLIGAGFALLAGAVAGIKLGLFGGGNG